MFIMKNNAQIFYLPVFPFFQEVVTTASFLEHTFAHQCSRETTFTGIPDAM